MKIKTILPAAALCIGMLYSSSSMTSAANIYKADVPDSLNLGTSWTGGIAPGASDIAVWDNTVQINTNTSSLGAPLSWSGIQILDPAGLITVNADGNALTLGASGIDMSLATNGLTLDNDVVLGANQTWNVANGQTLTVAGVISGASALTTAGGGIVLLSGANTYTGGTLNNGVVQANNGTSFGTGGITNNDGSTFLIHTSTTEKNPVIFNGTVTIDLNNFANNAGLNGSWSGSGTVNFINQDSSAARTFTIGGGGNGGGNMANFTGTISFGTNTGIFRFNDGGSSQNTGNSGATFDLGTGTATFFTRNKNAAVNFGALTGGPGTIIKQGSSSSGTSTYTIGAKGVSTTFAGTIQDGGSSAAIAITKTGNDTFTLTGTNIYVGATTISSGTLQVGDGGTSGQLGSGTIINNSTLIYDRSDDIILTNAVSGSGTMIKTNTNTLTYNGTDTSFGEIAINQGVVALGSAGSISSTIFVGDGASFDVSQNPSFILNSTLSGFGTIAGTLTASGGIISPGGDGAAGILTFSSGLTESGGANNRMELSTSDGTNDLINVTGDLNLSGVNNIILNAFGGGAIPNGTYTLINYSGNFNGSLDNLAIAVAGATAVLTNPPNQIAVIISPAARGATNLTWVGDGSANDWDVDTSTNWISGTTPFTFLTGDSVLFNNSGAANPVVNVTATVLPAQVTVDSSSDYVLTGNGSIRGSTGLTKTNSGVLTIDMTNGYTGPTIISGGALQVFSVADAGLPGPIGAASGESSNLVFYSSTFRYLSADSPGMNRNATFAGSGATIDITNSSANFTENGSFDGSGALIKDGSGTLTLANASSYSGGTVISNGVLALGSNDANNSGAQSGVGPTNSPVTFYGGTLQLFGYNGSTTPTYNSFYNPLTVPTGQTGTLELFCRASGLYSSLTGGGTLNLVINYVRDDLVGDWSGFAGVINVTSKPSGQGDEMRIHNSYGYANATINLNDGVLMDSVVSSATIDIGELDGTSGSVIGTGNGSSPNPTWCIGWKNTSSTYSGSITNDGVTSLIKVGTGTLALDSGGIFTNISSPDGFNYVTNISYQDTITYTGSTTISNGVLAFISPASLTGSASVTLDSASAVLDASQMGYISNQYDSDGVTVTNQFLVTNGVFEVVSGQTLAGIGTILASNVLADAGSIVNVGLPTGTLTAMNGIELGGTVNVNLNAAGSPNCSELIAQSFVIDPTATLVVNNLGVEAGAKFQLFNHPVTFTSVVLPTLSGTNSWVNNLAEDGSITLIAPPPVTVNAAPTNIVASVSGGNMTLSWPADHTGWRLQTQTNSLNVGLGTNWVDVPGSTNVDQEIIPVGSTNGAVFFRLIYP